MKLFMFAPKTVKTKRIFQVWASAWLSLLDATVTILTLGYVTSLFSMTYMWRVAVKEGLVSEE